MKPFDYLCIGHITSDVTPHGRRVGGTVAFAGQLARTLGCRTAVLTSCRPDEPGLQALDGIQAHAIPAAETSTFENIYQDNVRRQILHGRASRITTADLPPGWPQSSIVHFGPVANEIDEELVRHFAGSIIGLTPQGWMRRWDEAGRIHADRWPAAAAVLPLADVVVLSEEDIIDQQMLAEYVALSRLLILTENVAGCKLFWQERVRQVSAPAVPVVDPTGAGDIFAAAFLVDYARNGRDPHQAAEFANFVAAHSITRAGLPAKMDLLAELLPQLTNLKKSL